MSSEQRTVPTEDDLTATRRAKLAELRAQGWAYPNQFAPTHHARALHDAHDATDGAALDEAKHPAQVAGRVVAKRDMGKASFVVVEDVTGRIQTYLRRDRLSEDQGALARTLDLGDVVGVAGTIFRTRTGELTVEASRLVLLAKCLHPLPEKWHGLTDVEIRYRKRYLDLIANGDVRQTFLARARILAGIRRFLVERDFVEVETPILQTIAGGAAAKPFVTHHNTLDLALQLRIAPELFLKRLLVGGFERVFEIGRNFRNEGISTQHNPEFTMLEFYQAYATWTDLLPLVEEMIGGLAQRAHRLVGGAVRRAPDRPRSGLEAAVAARRDRARRRLRRRAICATPSAPGRWPQRHGVPVPPGAGAGGIADRAVRALRRARTDPADLRHRLSRRGRRRSRARTTTTRSSSTASSSSSPAASWRTASPS